MILLVIFAIGSFQFLLGVDPDYSLVIKIIIGFSTFMILVLCWSYYLQRLNRKLVASKAELAHAHDLMRYIMEHNHTAFAVHDRDLKFINVSQRYLDDFKLKKEDVIGNYHNEVFSDIDEKWKVIHYRALNGEVLREEDDQIVRRDGTVEWIRWECRPWYDAVGSIGGVINYLEVVTVRKQAEEALKESEEKHRLLIARMQQGIAVHEMIFNEAGIPINYRFIDVNDSFERLTGLKREDILGKTVLDILPGTETYWIEKYGQVAITGEPLQYENYSKELGKYFEVMAYSPRPKEFAVIISDITERKKLESELSKEKNLLETTLISVGDGVISTDPKGNVVFLNKAAEMLTGWSPEEAKGHPIEDVFNIVDELTREKSVNLVEEVLKRGGIPKLANHTILISKDGIERPVEDSAAPILLADGEAIGVVLVFRDFSEKKQKQEEILYLSYHDQLTGLYNRRFYEEELKRLDTERNLPMTIIMADVNGLKLINDSFGHILGDQLLEKAAEVITKGCRADDIIARIGGDEFVVLLPKTNGIDAEQIIKRIQELASNERVGSVTLSISFGYATKCNDTEMITEIFKNAEDNMYRHKLYESASIKSKTIDLIMNALYEKSNREMMHSKRVSEICEGIGINMGFDHDSTNQLRIAGLMHDIGKMGIDARILNRPHSLTNDEWIEMKRHPEIGYRTLSTVNEFSEMAEYILEHHERWDGKGYPKGLKGKEISLEARIIAVAESYDTMINNGIYRTGLNEEEAIAEIKRNAGTQFDPEIAQLFIEKVLKKEWN